MNRNITVGIGADPSGFTQGINTALRGLSNLGSAAARFGGEFASHIGGGLAAAGRSVNQFTTQANSNLTNFYRQQDQEQKRFEAGWGRLGDSIATAGKRLTIGLTAPLVLLGTQSFKAYSEIDSLTRGLTAVMHSAEGAGREFKALRVVSGLPGLGLEEAAKGSVRLQAVGLSAESARNSLLQFGNAITTTGGGKTELNSVTVQLAQLAAKGKVLSQDLRPIIEAAPAVAPALKKIFNSIDPEEISEKLKAAGKDSRYFIEILTTELSKLDRVSGGPKNAMENLGDSVKVAEYNFGLAADRALGLTGILDGLGNYITKAADNFGNLSQGAQVGILGFTALAAAIGPVALGIGTLITLGPQFVQGFTAMKTAVLALGTPLGAVAVAIGATIGAIAILGNSIEHYSGGLEKTADRAKILASVNDQVTASIGGESNKLSQLLGIARDETISKKARQQAIKDLNAISPEYLRGLTLETINTAQATNAVNQYSTALRLKAKTQILSQEAANTEIALEKAKAKSTRDYVDRSRFSKDQIAINIKTTGSFSPQEDRARLFNELGKSRKDAEVSRLTDASKVINAQYKKAYDEANKLNIKLTPPKVVTDGIDFTKIGGDSELKKLKDHYKELDEQIGSLLAHHQKVPAALAADFKKTAAELKRVKADTKTIGGLNKPAKEGSVNPYDYGDLAIAKRFEKELETSIQNMGGKAPQKLIDQLHDVRSLILDLQSLTAKDMKVDIVGLKELTNPGYKGVVRGLVDNFLQLEKIVPGLFDKSGVNKYYSDFQKLLPSADYYYRQLEDIQSVISKLSINKQAIPQKAFDDLNRYTAAIQRASKAQQEAKEAAEFKAEEDRKGDLPVNASFGSDKLGFKVLDDSVDKMPKTLRSLKDGISGILSETAQTALIGMGEVIGGLIAGTAGIDALPKMLLSALGGMLKQLGVLAIQAGIGLKAIKVAFETMNPVVAIVAGIGLIALGTVIQSGAAKIGGNVKGYEKGGLFTGASIIEVGETHKARGGGGEWVTPVDRGAALVANQLVRLGAVNTASAGAKSDTDKMDSYSSQPTPVNVTFEGNMRLSGSDLLVVMRRAESKSYVFGNGTFPNGRPR